MDQERDSGELVADPAAVLEHEVHRLRCALALEQARNRALEAEAAKLRGKQPTGRSAGAAA